MRLFSRKNGDIWISAALYLVISIVVITIIISAGVPMLENMRDKNAFEDSKKSLLVLDQHISEVANEGPGSQRVIPLEIKKGTISLEENGITWSMKTNADIIDPRTKIKTGNLIISSNVDVNAYEDNSSCTMENSKVRVKIKKVGDPNCDSDQSFCANLSTTGIITEFADISDSNNEYVADGNFSFKINDIALSDEGVGYTVCDKVGNDLDYASTLLHMYNTKSTPAFNYTLEFILDSEGDFVKVKVLDIKVGS